MPASAADERQQRDRQRHGMRGLVRACSGSTRIESRQNAALPVADEEMEVIADEARQHRPRGRGQ